LLEGACCAAKPFGAKKISDARAAVTHGHVRQRVVAAVCRTKSKICINGVPFARSYSQKESAKS
jgi:hypothetical protein